MTRAEAIEHACRTVALAYRSLGDFLKPSDGFCDTCASRLARLANFGAALGEKDLVHYENAGEALAYVRTAVIEKLEREGRGEAMRRVVREYLDVEEVQSGSGL